MLALLADNQHLSDYAGSEIADKVRYESYTLI